MNSSLKNRVPAALTLVLALLLGLTACGTDTSSNVGAAQGAATPTTPPSPTRASGSVGGGAEAVEADPEPEAAPARELKFAAETVDGRRFDGTALAGKDAVFWFWAPWCTECQREAPHVAAAQKEHADVEFVGVAGLGETPAMRSFVDDYKVGAFEHLADLDGTLWQRFGVVQQPAYAFIDAGGSVKVVRGELGPEGLARHIGTLHDS